MEPLKQREDLSGGRQVFPRLTEGLGRQSRKWMAVGSQGTTGKELGAVSVRKIGRGATPGDGGQPALLSSCHSVKSPSLRIGDATLEAQGRARCLVARGRGEGGRRVVSLCSKADTVERRSFPQGTQAVLEMDRDSGRVLRRFTPATSNHVPSDSSERTESPKSLTFWRGATRQVVLYRKKNEAGSRVLIFKRALS